ncbi:NADPH-dependent FMN reductase [Roseinatronobacter sp. S2]|uniref:NADPH-dependent FMN reductase n=1 Tax=Roseinatronobacter sp. S2 TaxID=3035471 RepID=UPI00241049A0|nr:NADPH-dependent FMN reductase [Roseinatronobacter sp. S2]WFE73993.1 NAD(P)H-dependent oxidoreductase [Roseinatronobacter sp. S2]
MRIMAVSGSLRENSSNKSLIDSLPYLAPENVNIDVYDGIGKLPHFNPDIDKEPHPAPVAHFLARLSLADGLVICSPEYAHGVAGVMKNAVDWTVGNSGLEGKPVALINASPRSQSAQEHLSATLRLLGDYVEDASIAVPVAGTGMDAQELARNPEIAPLIRSALAMLCRAIARN